MGNEILLMDGARYEEWAPTSHDELVQILREHYKEIFGPDSLFIEVRQTLRGGAIGAIPDSYCLTFNPDTLWIVEVELSRPSCFTHIQNQLNRFLNGLFNPVTRQIDAGARQDLRDALFSSLARADQQNLQTRVGRPDPWLEGLISSPSLVVVTDNAADEVRRACGSAWIPARPLELRTFRRVGAEAVHIHQFEPLFPRSQAPLTLPVRTAAPAPRSQDVSLVPAMAMQAAPPMVVELTQACLKYGVVGIPRKHRAFFPEFAKLFVLESDVGQFESRVAGGKGSKPGTQDGHELTRFGRFYKKHPELKVGSQLRFEALEPGRKYRLTVERV